MSNKIKLAKDLARMYHKNQLYGTECYFTYHISGVVKLLKIHNLSSDYIIVGYLHDSVEDTSLSLDTIENLFGRTIRDAVDAITKRDGESREQYLARCAANKIARVVKLHDATFNATNCFKNKNKARFNTYISNIALLSC